MARLPFGVRRLDSICDGGAPPGSVVLLAGEPGAGAREFLISAVVMNGLAQTDPDRFELAYGTPADSASPPEGIHYLSLPARATAIEREWRQTFDPEVIEASLNAISVTDLAASYFSGPAVPAGWFAESPNDEASGERDLLGALAAYLEENGSNSLVAIDSLTALGPLPEERVSWEDTAVFLAGLRHAVEDWGGLVLLLVDEPSVPARAMAQLGAAVDGVFRFEWVAGGHEIDRTMVLEKFRGVLATIDDEDIVRFETDIDGSGFELSEVRKIR